MRGINFEKNSLVITASPVENSHKTIEKSDQTDFKSKYQMSEKLVVLLIVTGECEADTIDI